jgi:hypothetical protein
LRNQQFEFKVLLWSLSGVKEKNEQERQQQQETATTVSRPSEKAKELCQSFIEVRTTQMYLSSNSKSSHARQGVEQEQLCCRFVPPYLLV